MKTILMICSIGYLGLVGLVPTVSAQTHSEVLKNYLTDDVIAMGFIDGDKIDVNQLVQLASAIGLREPDEADELAHEAAVVSGILQNLKTAGVVKVYALFRASDIASRGTSLVFPIDTGHNPATAAEAIRELVKLLPASAGIHVVEPSDGVVYATRTAEQMTRLKNDRPTAIRDYSPAWDALGGGTAGLVWIGDPDSRRVIREFFPILPSPFENITGTLPSDSITWAGISVGLPPQLGLKCEIQSNNESSAKQIEAALQTVLEVIKRHPTATSYIPEQEIDFVFGALQPVRNGTRLSVSLEKLIQDQGRLVSVLAPNVRAVRAMKASRTRLNHLRQLALAMLNYESAHKFIPAAVSVDENGAPLLSWRVEVLPFLGEMELYDQFHLDEAWDSPNNLPLAKQMPEVYQDTMPGYLKTNKAGKTVFQVAIGKGLVFDGAMKSEFRDITDGSSNTILVATVAREHAVTWTKPDDWKVDLQNPKAQLVEPGRTRFEVVFLDGSTHMLKTELLDKTLRLLVNPADGEALTEGY